MSMSGIDVLVGFGISTYLCIFHPTLPFLQNISSPQHRISNCKFQTKPKEATQPHTMSVSNVSILSPPAQLHPNKKPLLTRNHQVMKAAFPSGFISMAPAADTDTASLASNSTSTKSLSHSGPVNAGNDTYKFYDGDGGDGWPGMEQWVDFYSM
jgi:hypothetical protein